MNNNIHTKYLIMSIKLLSLSPLLLVSHYSAAQESFIGEIKYTGANFCPRGTTEANGQLLAINQYQALFSLLGTNFGGDGRTSFGLPDYRGRTPNGFDNNNRLGNKGGNENIGLTANHLPAHTHNATTISQVNVSTGRGRLSSPQNAVLADDGNDKVYLDALPDVIMDPISVTSNTQISNSGGGTNINNMQPYQVITACISLQGLFPSRN